MEKGSNNTTHVHETYTNKKLGKGRRKKNKKRSIGETQYTTNTLNTGKWKMEIKKNMDEMETPPSGVPEVWCGPQSKLFLPLASHPPSLSEEQGSAADTT